VENGSDERIELQTAQGSGDRWTRRARCRMSNAVSTMFSFARGRPGRRRFAARGTSAHFIIRRLGVAIPTVVGVVTLAFLILRLAPGDPVTTLLGDYAGRPELVAEITRQYGLDQPLVIQYLLYVFHAFTGDFGISLRTSQPVLTEILDVLPYTFSLAIAAVLVSIVVGVPLGVASAVWADGPVDHMARLVALIGVCMPNFAFALLLMFVFSFSLNLFPMLGVGDWRNPLDFASHLVLPALALGLRDAATLSRMLRASMVALLRQDYITTARAKGLSEPVVVLKHAMKNALVGAITIISLEFGHVLGSTVVIETVFGRPGLGTLIVQAISARDYPQLQGALIVFAVCIILINLIADLLYRWADPRIAYGAAP
jgi:peptide/nickel transport system permease protein